MSMTKSLFHNAVKVLRRGFARKQREMQSQIAAQPRDVFAQGIRFEPMESRLLLSTVTIESIADATEGGADGTFRITRDDTIGDLTVFFSRSGKATLGATRDYLLSDGVNNLTTSVVIPDGAATVDITIAAVDDTLAEPTETVILNLKTSKTYDLSPDVTTRTATANIEDNEPVVSIVATDTEASETLGETGTFTITRVGNTTGDLLVRFKVTGTAKRGSDFLFTAGGDPVTTSVVIPDGQASIDILVTPVDDNRFEQTENVNLQLLSSKLFNLGLSTASVIIADDEPLVFVDPTSTAPASFTINNNTNLGADTFIITGPEANETHDAGPLFIEFARDGALLINQNRPLEVRNAEGLLNAESRKAYVSFDMSLFPFGNFSNAIFTLTLVDTSGASPSNTNFKFNVFGLKDDFVPSGGEQDEDWNEDINYGDAPGNADPGGSVDLSDMFSGGPLGSFNIVGTGTVGQSFSISGQLLTDFLNNESTLDADGDQLVTFIIVRENVGNPDTDTVVHMFGSRDDPFGEADIDVIPQLTVFGEVAGQNVAEDDVTSIRIFRQGNTVGDVTVPFKVTGSARMGLDYRLEVNGVQVFNSFVIPDGSDFVDISVITLDDAVFEISESIIITLGTSNTFALDGQNKKFQVNITDNEPVITLVAGDPEAQEPNLTTSNLDTGFWTLSRTGSTAEALTVNVKFSGTALNGKDYELISKQIVFLAGEATVDVVLDPMADFQPEGSESATMTIVPSTSYGLNWTLRGTRSTTGTTLGPTTVAAANISQARQLAKNLGFSGPRLTPLEQSDTIVITNGVPAPGPDLIASFFTLTNTTVSNTTVGGAFGTFTVTNQGTVAVGAFSVQFIISANRVFGDAGDITLPIQNIAGLKAGASIKIAVIFDDISTLTAGNYMLGATVDADDFILETIEDNNFSGTDDTPITITD